MSTDSNGRETALPNQPVEKPTEVHWDTLIKWVKNIVWKEQEQFFHLQVKKLTLNLNIFFFYKRSTGCGDFRLVFVT